MNKKLIKCAAVACGILMFASSIILNVELFRANRVLVNTVNEQRGGLTKDECSLLLQDFASTNADRVAAWKDYFNHSAALERSGAKDIDALYKLYTSMESPKRSDYFYDMFLALCAKQQTEGLTKEGLVHYLGAPDQVNGSPNDQFLEYHFASYGRKCIAFVKVRSGIVDAMNFNVAPRSDQ